MPLERAFHKETLFITNFAFQIAFWLAQKADQSPVKGPSNKMNRKKK
jgi:hypothetical protein